MKNLEMMKQYIREHNLCGRVRELVEGIRGGAAQEITHLTMAAWQQPKPFCRGRQDGRGSQPQKGRFLV